MRTSYPPSLPQRIDINADLGEGMGIEALIMPWISSANIACGFHAGDADTIRTTVDLCLMHGVAIGAHPSFDDRSGFGRQEMIIPDDELTELIIHQIRVIQRAAKASGGSLHHVKPHGALYTMATRDAHLARVLCKAILEVDPYLVLYGLSGSHMITEGHKAGLRTMSEVFADRTYQDDGQLTPRSQPGAMITEVSQACAQILRMIREGHVTSTSGKKMDVKAETVCIHGDGPHAVDFAKRLYQSLEQSGIVIVKYPVA